MTAVIIDGKALAATIHEEVATQSASLREAGWQPHLVSITVGDTAAAEIYVRNQSRNANAAGVTFESRDYPEDTSLEQLIGILQALTPTHVLTELLFSDHCQTIFR